MPAVAQRKQTLRDRVHCALCRFYDWKNKYHCLGRYLVKKLLAVEEHQHETRLMRAVGMFVLTPVPSLLIMFALAAIPLQSPLLGATENILSFVQSACAHTCMNFGMLLFMRQSLG